MTRAESDAAKREIQHADYMKRREANLAYAKQYAIDNGLSSEKYENNAKMY